MTPWAHNLRKSFATLSKHHATGRFDRARALRLLRNNARDAGLHGAAAAGQARQWLNRWMAINGVEE